MLFRSTLAAKTITADKITGGICSATVSFTAPSITVNGSTFTVNIDSGYGVKVTKGTASISLANATAYCADTGGAGPHGELGPTFVSFGASSNSAYASITNGSSSRNMTLTDNSGTIQVMIGAGSVMGGAGINLEGGANYRVNGQQVVTARYTGALVVLSDVIACLNYHGLH